MLTRLSLQLTHTVQKMAIIPRGFKTWLDCLLRRMVWNIMRPLKGFSLTPTVPLFYGARPVLSVKIMGTASNCIGGVILDHKSP